MFRLIGVLAVLAGLFIADFAAAQVKLKFKTPEAQAAYEAKQERKKLEEMLKKRQFDLNMAAKTSDHARREAIQAEILKEAYRAEAALQAARAAQAQQAAAANQAAALAAAAVAAASNQGSGPVTYRDGVGNWVTEYPNGMRRMSGPLGSTITEYPNGIREERSMFGEIKRDVPVQPVELRFQPYYRPYSSPYGW